MHLIGKGSVNRTIRIVEHDMDAVSHIADDITALRRGAVLAEGPCAEVSKNPSVVEASMRTVH